MLDDDDDDDDNDIPRPLKLPTRIVALNIPSWWRNTYSIGIYISFIIMGVMEKIKVRRNV